MNGGCRGAEVHGRRPSGARARGQRPEDTHTFQGLRPPGRKRARGARAATTARTGRGSPGRLVTETSPLAKAAGEQAAARPQRSPRADTSSPRAARDAACAPRSGQGARIARAGAPGRWTLAGPVTGPEAARVTPPRQRPPPRPRLLIGRRAPHVTTGTSRF